MVFKVAESEFHAFSLILIVIFTETVEIPNYRDIKFPLISYFKDPLLVFEVDESEFHGFSLIPIFIIFRNRRNTEYSWKLKFLILIVFNTCYRFSWSLNANFMVSLDSDSYIT